MRHFETYCEIIKEEPLSTLEPDWTIPDTCVLEAVSPYFGYYNDAPMANPDPYIYFVLNQHYLPGEIFRITNRIKARTHDTFDAAIGSIFHMNQTFPVIRIKNISHYDRAVDIQHNFQEEGILFKSRQRKIYEQMVITRLSKFIFLEPHGDGLYLDVEDRTKGYFVLPACYEWSDFKALTVEAKYDTCILHFDAAQALIIQNNDIQEMVRVYKEKITPEALRAIRDRYHQLI